VFTYGQKLRYYLYICDDSVVCMARTSLQTIIHRLIGNTMAKGQTIDNITLHNHTYTIKLGRIELLWKDDRHCGMVETY